MINMIVLQPLVALIAGIPIFVILRLLNFVVAIYLIITRHRRPVAASASLKA